MKNESLSASLEDYLEAIYLICREKQMAPANQIAEHLQVGKSSVSWALNQLSEKGLINYTPYEAITLTDQGLSLAESIVRRHEDIKQFLINILAIDEKTAEANACRLEHVLDPEVLRKMKEFECISRKNPFSHPTPTDELNTFDRREISEQSLSPPSKESSPSIPETAPAGAEPALPKLSKQRDQKILDRLKEILHESGSPLTDPDLTVANVFMGSEKHQTLESIYQHARQLNPRVNRSDVERVLDILCEHKIARAFIFRDQCYYEHLHPESHHDHLFCVKCGAIIEFYDPRLEQLQHEQARSAGFRLLHHTHNMYGVCRDCLRREAHLRTLDTALAGERVEVVRLLGDKTTSDRIAQMGLAPGTHLQILNDRGKADHLIVMAAGARLMLDPATARHVRVTSLPPETVLHPLGRRCHQHPADRTEPFWPPYSPRRRRRRRGGFL